MIYIRKRKTPNIIVEKATAIKKDPASGYEKLELPQDSTQMRFLFEQMPKATIPVSYTHLTGGKGTTCGNIRERNLPNTQRLA